MAEGFVNLELKTPSELLDDISRLRKALEWYAKGGSNWDRGKRARVALGAGQSPLEGS